MAEHKAPDPMWTTETVNAVREKIYSEYEPHCKTDLGRMLARDVATVIAQQFQLCFAVRCVLLEDLFGDGVDLLCRPHRIGCLVFRHWPGSVKRHRHGGQ